MTCFPRCRLTSNGLHGFMSHKTEVFNPLFLVLFLNFLVINGFLWNQPVTNMAHAINAFSLLLLHQNGFYCLLIVTRLISLLRGTQDTRRTDV